MRTKKKLSKSKLGIIFLTVFIDLLGVTVIIPVLPALFFEADTSMFSAAVSEDTRSILYGLLIGSYPFMQFFGAPILGSLSDRRGRKPVLLAALTGTMAGYILFGIAILTQNIWLLFFSRMLPGFTGGNIAIILSVIADVSDEKSKTKNFGLVSAAFGLGFILGPTIGGILADDSIVSWFGHETPFWFTAILTFCNIILVRFAFPETLKKSKDTDIRFFTGIKNIAVSFREENLRRIFTVVLLMSLGFSFFTQFFSVYLIQIFDYSEKDIGFLYGWIGIWLILTQTLIIRRLSNYYAPGELLIFSMLALSVFIATVLLPGQAAWFYILSPLIAMSQGITAPNLTSFVSTQATEEQQGAILGINQSMQSLGQIVPPLIAGWFLTFNENLPLIAAAAFTFLGWLAFFIFFRTSGSKHAGG